MLQLFRTQARLAQLDNRSKHVEGLLSVCYSGQSDPTPRLPTLERPSYVVFAFVHLLYTGRFSERPQGAPRRYTSACEIETRESFPRTITT